MKKKSEASDFSPSHCDRSIIAAISARHVSLEEKNQRYLRDQEVERAVSEVELALEEAICGHFFLN